MLSNVISKPLEIGGRTWHIQAVSDAEVLLARVQTDEDLSNFPYGLLLWPAAVALAESLMDVPLLVQGRRILELGCGPGLPGLIAQSLGADVTQTDYQDAPLALARENAARNGVAEIRFIQGDWRDFPLLPPFDVVIGSDILYERALHPALHALLPRVLTPTGTLWIADPLRPQAASFVDELEQNKWDVTMSVKTIAWQEQHTEIALFTARREGQNTS